MPPVRQQGDGDPSPSLGVLPRQLADPRHTRLPSLCGGQPAEVQTSPQMEGYNAAQGTGQWLPGKELLLGSASSPHVTSRATGMGSVKAWEGAQGGPCVLSACESPGERSRSLSEWWALASKLKAELPQRDVWCLHPVGTGNKAVFGTGVSVLVSAAAGNKSATWPPLPPPACGGE